MELDAKLFVKTDEPREGWGAHIRQTACITPRSKLWKPLTTH